MELEQDKLSQSSEDVPDFVKDIKKKSNPISLPLETEFIPQNPYTMNGGEISYQSNQNIHGIKETSPFLETAKAEAYDWNYTAQGAHGLYEKVQQDILDDTPPTGWNSKTDISKFVNIRPQYFQYLFDAKGPRDQDYRLQRVLSEQQHDDTLANGSWQAKVIGGLVGIATDPMSYIPVVGWAKYAKFAPTVFKSAARALPGITTQAVLSSAAEQTDKINGNMTDFFTDSFVRSAFGTVLFGGLGAASLGTDKLALWGLKDFAKNVVDGIDFKLAVDEGGKVNGIKAFDPSGTLSAAKVSFAQDLANSSFSKQGVFKIPYLGEAVTKFLSMPGLGTPLPKLLNSPFMAVRGFVDRVADHSIITTGVKEGNVSPRKFSSLMNQEYAQIRSLGAQVDALHLERNGFDIKNRALGGIVNLGLNLKDKGISLLSQDLDKSEYISKEDFYQEIEQVLHSKESSQHPAVNDAARMIREQLDITYTKFRKAYSLPEDWMPPKTAEGYLMRVYDTPYMNVNEDKWINVVSNWLKDADEEINTHMQPINSLREKIKSSENIHQEFIRQPGISDKQVKRSSDRLNEMKSQLTSMEEKLQNELRNNPDLKIHVEDHTALSSDEAKKIKQLKKPLTDLESKISDQEKIISDLKKNKSKSKSASNKSKSGTTAKKHAQGADLFEKQLNEAEEALSDLKIEHYEEEDKLRQLFKSGEVDYRLYEKANGKHQFKDTSKRLKFRETYKSHDERIIDAKAYYNTILNQTSHDTVNQVMGKLVGNNAENPVKGRTLLIPDQVLYDNSFMTKNLMSKVSNYTTYLGRRTHLKNVFNDVSIDGGIEPLLEELNNEHENFRTLLNEEKVATEKKLSKEDIGNEEKKKLIKKLNSVDKELIKRRKEFDTAKKQMNHIYQKMMGISTLDRRARQIQSAIMSFTAVANLPFVPFTMINDLSAIGLQHGVWPFIRDGIAPLIESLGGILKTKDSEALRNSAPSVHLALQDVSNGYADKNWGMHNEPYLNLGKWVGAAESMAHFSSNFALTNYIDNGLQRITGSVTQSEIMRILHTFKSGKMSERDGIYIRNLGLDPKLWSERMINAFKQDGGGKTKLGGYQSNFWRWSDKEASNELGDAVFRAIKMTQIQSGIADSPFWADINGPLGIMAPIIKGFNGWMFASINRYVIPTLQQPDAEKLLGVLFMLGTGALVDPMRRMARGESPYPDNITPEQIMWSTFNNSGFFSYFANVLSDANVMTGDRLLGDLKNDKYKDRTRAGLLGPAWGTANRMADIIGAAGSGEWNKSDMTKAARMIPVANSSWTYWMSKKLIDSLNIPQTRAKAHALKQANQ